MFIAKLVFFLTLFELIPPILIGNIAKNYKIDLEEHGFDEAILMWPIINWIALGLIIGTAVIEYSKH